MRIKGKQYILVLIVIAIIMMLSVIPQNYETFEEVELVRKGDANLDASIVRSNVGLVGKFTAYREKGEVIEFEFIVEDVLYGNVPEDNINICIASAEQEVLNLYENTYTIGDSYILILCRHESLFREYARYSIVNDIHIPMNNMADATFKGNKISVNGNLKSYIKNYARKNGYTAEYIPLMFRNEDLKTVVQSCELLIQINVLEIGFEGVLANQNTYTCEVANIIKGGEYILDGCSIIYINAFKGSMTPGESYYIALNRIDNSDKNTVFNQASPNGIINYDNEETISEIKQWLIGGVE